MNGVVSRMVNDEVFSAEDAELEVQRLQREPSASFWSPVEGMKFTLIIPPRSTHPGKILIYWLVGLYH